MKYARAVFVFGAICLWLAALLQYLPGLRDAQAQGVGGGSAPANIRSIPESLTITTGLTYQAITLPPTRRSLTIENNNTNGDNCLLDLTGTVAAGNTTATTVTINSAMLTAAQASILLGAGGSYQRYYPYVPSGAIVVTCTTTGDSVYVDAQ